MAKGTENCKILGSFLDKEVENLEDHGCSKVQDSLMKKCGYARVTHSHTRPHFTQQSAVQNCLVTG